MGRRENRRHPRLETRQSASVSAMSATVPCEIRNFCRVGLYLSFADPQARDAVSAWLPDTLVEIAFAASKDGHQRHFRMTGTVAHASPAGLGVYVQSMPEGALRALHAAGARAAARRAPVLAPQERQAMQRECTSLFSDFLNVVVKDFFAGVGDKFLEASDQASGFLEQNRFREAPQALTAQRTRIQEGLSSGIRAHLQQLERGPAPARDHEVSGELSLVDEAEFEDWLNLSSVVNQIESEGDFARCLSGFERRYGLLIGKTVDRRNNPFGPEAICRCFQASTRGLDFSNAMRALMYKAFGQSLVQHLPALCEQLERVLSPLDALLPPTRPIARQGRTPPPTPTAAADSATAKGAGGKHSPRRDPDETVARLLSLSGQHPPFQPDAPEYSMERLVAALNRARGGSAAARALPPQGPGADGPPPRPNLLSVADKLLLAATGGTGGRPDPGPAAAALEGVSAPDEAALGDLLRIIDALPSAGWIGQTGPDRPPLSERISRSGKGVRIPLPYRQALDTAGNLFGHAMALSAGGSAIDALLKRLERPLLKLCLQDGGFPDTPDHPARQVVDLLEQYAIAADDQGRFFDAKLQHFLHVAVERICTQADHEPGVYAAVRDNLARLLAPIRQTRQLRVARLQEACEGRHRIRQARARVRDALDARLAGREVPEIVLRLLDAGWRQYLVLLEMRAGIDGDAWAQALAVLDRLLALLQPELRRAPTESRQEVVAVSNLIEQQLASVNPDAGERDALMEALAETVDAAVRDGRAPTTASYAPAGGPAQAGTGEDESVSDHAALLKRLCVGDWWQFLEGGRWLPMQLIWLSEPPGDCAFANRSATHKVELTLTEFGQRMQDGSVKVRADQDRPLLERSEHAMLDDGRQLL
jgi:hypothetical protein